MEHTATPWILRIMPYPGENDKHWIDAKDGKPLADVRDYGDEGQANAELIVRAVNSHDRLKSTGYVLAILSLQSIRYTYNSDFRDAVDDLLAAIKQAEKEIL